MDMISRILVPVDFSETSAKALQYAERLARSTGAELLLAHAFSVPETLDLAGQLHAADPQLPGQLAAVAATLQTPPREQILHAGTPGDVICWLAQNRQCDLIVMGTHGRTGLMHLLMGSVAAHVLQHARCPVLVVRNRPDNEPPLLEPMVLPIKAPRLM